MSTGYVAVLAGVVVVLLGARLLLPGLPLRRSAVRLTGSDAALAGLGVLGLVFHCGAMFFSPLFSAIPGSGPAIAAINALGTASLIGYVIPALLVLAGLRRQHRATLLGLALALLAVGITMYDGGALNIHLAAIFLTIVLLAGVAAALVQPPRRRVSAPR